MLILNSRKIYVFTSTSQVQLQYLPHKKKRRRLNSLKNVLFVEARNYCILQQPLQILLSPSALEKYVHVIKQTSAYQLFQHHYAYDCRSQ